MRMASEITVRSSNLRFEVVQEEFQTLLAGLLDVGFLALAPTESWEHRMKA